MYSLIAMVSNLENLLTLILPKETQKEIMCLGHFSVLLSNCLMFCNFTILHSFMYLYFL